MHIGTGSREDSIRMRALVTGGTGFTGSALAIRLLEDGHEVVVLDTKEGIRLERLRELGAEVRFASVTDPTAVDEAMKGVEIVHHVAAAFREIDQPDEHYHDVNVNGTRIVLEAAERNGVRKFIHCSTCGVHGNVKHPPADEDAPIAPSDFYQETKWLGELEVRRFAERGLDTVILRPCAIYGPGDPGRFRLLFRQVATGRFPMFGPGTARYHTVFIDNFVDAFLLAMAEGCGSGGTYLIADEECLSIEELVMEVARAMQLSVRIIHLPLAPLVAAGHVVERACRPFGISPPIFPRRVDWYRQNRAFDIGRAKNQLGYAPKVPLREGLARTASWYRERGLVEEDTNR